MVLTHSLTHSMDRDLLERPAVPQLVKKFPTSREGEFSLPLDISRPLDQALRKSHDSGLTQCYVKLSHLRLRFPSGP